MSNLQSNTDDKPLQARADIVFDNVDAGYGNYVLLRHINFGIASGDWAFIIGEPASGKSLLHRLILRQIAPLSGRIFVFGDFTTPNNFTTAAQAKSARKIAIVDQAPVFWEDLSVYANVCGGLLFDGTSDDYAYSVCVDLLKWLGLAPMMERKIGALSASERQLINIARALVGLPKLLLLDEPFQHLDAKQATRIMELLQMLYAQGSTIFMTTSDRGYCLDNGIPHFLISDGQIYRA